MLQACTVAALLLEPAAAPRGHKADAKSVMALHGKGSFASTQFLRNHIPLMPAWESRLDLAKDLLGEEAVFGKTVPLTEDA
mmetsp:Transcript_135264/g.420345  ORF Transcript_135264/g.420345 Transcript_135264/m.420345 type:complete len:81 (-) Transcript_135264:23-265(-)